MKTLGSTADTLRLHLERAKDCSDRLDREANKISAIAIGLAALHKPHFEAASELATELESIRLEMSNAAAHMHKNQAAMVEAISGINQVRASAEAAVAAMRAA